MVRYSRSPQVVTRCIGEETVLVPLAGADAADLENLYRLNETATVLWQALEEPRSGEELAQALRREFDTQASEADSSDVEEDVATFLDEMIRARLVRAAP